MEVAMPASTTASVASDPVSRAEWELLVRLPAHVITAVTGADAAAARTALDRAVGLGRAADSALVRGLAFAVHAGLEPAGPDVRPAVPVWETRVAGALAECRTAARILRERVARVDADAYRDWLVEVAVTACDNGHVMGLPGDGGGMLTMADRRFLDELRHALRSTPG
jgi:hypothetical protein